MRQASPSLPYSLLVLLAVMACAGRTANVETEPPAPEPLTEADFHGTYDVYMGGQPTVEGQPAPFTATWAEDELVLQDGQQTIRSGISIDPVKQEIRLWDPNTSDLLCGSEGIYVYEDDGETITLTEVADPCTNRASSADGARLIRR
jgi:hypothetical protein